jgi:hypothetical protein
LHGGDEERAADDDRLEVARPSPFSIQSHRKRRPGQQAEQDETRWRAR